MACGLPYAIAAGIAFPGRPVFAVVADGGFAVQLGEFSTAMRYRIPLKVLVLKNNMLNQIAWEQTLFLGNPQFGCELQPIDFAMAAEAMGGIIAQKTARMAAKLGELLPSIDPTPEFMWAGNFGATPTGLPLIGAVPNRPRIFALMGYDGNGVTFSRIAAELIRTAIAGHEDVDADADLFSL